MYISYSNVIFGIIFIFHFHAQRNTQNKVGHVMNKIKKVSFLSQGRIQRGGRVVNSPGTGIFLAKFYFQIE